MVVKYGGKQPSVSHKPKKMVTQRGCLMVRKMDTRLRNSKEICFCIRLKYKGIDGVLLLQGIKLRDGEIAKEVAGALILLLQ